MRIPVRLVCDHSDCDQEIQPDTCLHAIIGGIIFRFCSSAHRSQYTRARSQLVKQEIAHA